MVLCSPTILMPMFEYSMLSYTVALEPKMPTTKQSNHIQQLGYTHNTHTWIRQSKRRHAKRITCAATRTLSIIAIGLVWRALIQFHWKLNNIHQLYSLRYTQPSCRYAFRAREFQCNTVINTITKYPSIVNSILLEFLRSLCKFFFFFWLSLSPVVMPPKSSLALIVLNYSNWKNSLENETQSVSTRKLVCQHFVLAKTAGRKMRAAAHPSLLSS